MTKIYCAVYFPQQMVCRYEFLYAEYFYLVAVFSSLYYPFHQRFYYAIFTQKSPVFTGLFQQAETPSLSEQARCFAF